MKEEKHSSNNKQQKKLVNFCVKEVDTTHTQGTNGDTIEEKERLREGITTTNNKKNLSKTL